MRNWLKLAYSDFIVAKREIGHEDAVLEAVCFHLQQSVEKYSKTYLTAAGKKHEKTHNLTYLINKCAELDNEFSYFSGKFDLL